MVGAVGADVPWIGRLTNIFIPFDYTFKLFASEHPGRRTTRARSATIYLTKLRKKQVFYLQNIVQFMTREHPLGRGTNRM